MTQLDDIYSDRILQLSAGLGPAGRLDAPHGTATAHSKICGSTVTVDLKIADGRVDGFAQTVRACLLGQASASVMGRHIVGSSPQELREVAGAMRRMLREGGPPPGGRWAELEALLPVKDVRSRHPSTLLVFDAVEAALAQAEAGRPSGQSAAESAAASAGASAATGS